MNAGSFGGETREVLLSARSVNRRGEAEEHPVESLGLKYRRSSMPEGIIYVSARFQGRPDDAEAIAERMEAIRTARGSAQPAGIATGGSTFKNPGGKSAGLSTAKSEGAEGAEGSAWRLIDAAGCRGLRVGAAAVNDKHCNFLVNEGGATAAEIEALGEEIRRRVRENSGVELEWEIRRIGDPLEGGQ